VVYLFCVTRGLIVSDANGCMRACVSKINIIQKPQCLITKIDTL
jgi:hypothetical protein